ncbi:MAG TPA: HD domain-containing protein, partial [Candidatus Kapabacteria bacterium]|nr:HD domain-containing protein [Candidatus Kapabacteria bacterium]
MNQTDITYLGGLLHDIGKFAFRAQKTQRGVDHEMLGEMFASEYLTTKFECFKPKGNEILKALVRGNTFVREADHAAASERIKQESKETRRPLMSIFKYIDIGIGDAPSEVYYLEPKPLKRLNIEITRPVHKRNVTEKSW